MRKAMLLSLCKAGHVARRVLSQLLVNPADGRVEVTGGGWGNFRVALNQAAAT